MNDWTEQEVKSALEKIANRAASDAEYRTRALQEAHTVIEEVAGKKLPESVTLQFVELENGDLGMRTSTANGELRDEELGAVAGGAVPPGRFGWAFWD